MFVVHVGQHGMVDSSPFSSIIIECFNFITPYAHPSFLDFDRASLSVVYRNTKEVKLAKLNSKAKLHFFLFFPTFVQVVF